MAIEKVYLCPYSHSDWAWICYRRWHEKRYIRAFEITLDLMDRGTGFTWFIDSWHEQFGPVLENRPDLVERMKKHVEEGRFGLGPGMFTNPDPKAAWGETLVRNVLYGQRNFRKLFPAARFDAAMHVDCGGGSSQLPQMFKKMGFLAFTAGRPVQALKDKGIPRQFRWKGLDGTEIPCDALQTYALFCFSPYEPDSVRKYLEEQIGQSDERGCGTSLQLFFGWDDDCLPLGEPCWAADLFGQVENWNKTKKTKVELGIPAQLAQDMVEYSDDLPVVEGNLDPVGCSYRMTENGHDNIIDLRFRCGAALLQTERECMHYAEDYPAESLELFWTYLLSVYPHADEWLWNSDYDAFITKARATEQAVLRLRNDVRRATAMKISPAAEGRPIVFFNSLPFDREESCEFFLAVDEGGMTGFRISDGAGKALETQFFGDGFRGLGHGEDAKRMRCEFKVRTKLRIPACGYTTAYLHNDNAAESATKFERMPRQVQSGVVGLDIVDGAITKVSLDGVGAILNALDITFVETKEPTGNARANRRSTLIGLDADDPNEPPDNDVDAACGFTNYGVPVKTTPFKADEWSLMESGPLGARIFMAGDMAGNPTEIELFIHADTGRIDCDVKTYVLTPVSGYVFAGLEPTFEGEVHADCHFGVEPRNMLKEPFGSHINERGNFRVFWGQSWCDLSDGEKGVALLSQPGLNGYRAEDGRFEHLLLKVVAPQNVAGHRWANSQRTGLGLEKMQFAVLPHAGNWKSARIYREIEKYRYPVDGEDVLYKLQGGQPDTRRGLTVRPHNVTLSAFFQDGGNTMLRVYENAGDESEVEVDLPFDVSDAVITDLLGRQMDDGREVCCDDNTLVTTISPWEILTFRVSDLNSKE